MLKKVLNSCYTSNDKRGIMKHQNRIVFALFLVLALSGTASGENDKADTKRVFNRMPGVYAAQFDALGKRVKTQGREKTTYEGEFIDAQGNSTTARVVLQSPGLVKLEGFRKGGKSLSFDGENAKGSGNKADESLLETFLMDMPDGLFGSVQQSTASRLLGRDFGPDPKEEPNYTGPRYDIYDVTMPVVFKKNISQRSKLYFFDTQTRLLHKVAYTDRSEATPVEVETRFSAWGTIDESAYPARIDRYENGKLVFTFIATRIEGESAIDAANF
jgi:hypothetical protein